MSALGPESIVSFAHCGAACTGPREARPYWRRGHTPADAVIFVVDSSDTEQLGTSKDELLRLLVADAFWGLLLIVAFNKQDLPRAQTATHITQEWFKPTLLSSISSKWSTQATSYLCSNRRWSVRGAGKKYCVQHCTQRRHLLCSIACAHSLVLVPLA